MESVYTVRKHLLKEAFMVTIDLKVAYLHITFCSEHQGLLCFAFLTELEVQHWQFCALPFALVASPRVFTKILAEVIFHLQLQGIAPILLVYNQSGISCFMTSRGGKSHYSGGSVLRGLRGGVILGPSFNLLG